MLGSIHARVFGANIAAMAKRLHLFAISTALAVLIVSGTGFASTALAQQRIGLTLPLSGPTAKLARQFETGARLALNEHNADAAVIVELVVADDGCDQKIASLAADEIASAKPQIITGLLCNTVAAHFADAFREAGIPLLVAGAQSERLIKDRQRNEWNLWRLSPGDSEAAQAAVNHFSRAWADVPYAIVDDGTVYGRNLADAFRAGMEAMNLPPQFQDNFRPTQSTQARLVRRLRRSGVTHAFIGASAEDVAMIVRNAEELEIPLTFGSGEALSIFPYLAPELLPAGGLTGILRTAEVDPQPPQTLNSLLAEMDLQAEPYVLNGYQAMEVALQALGDGETEVAENLRTLEFDTLLGKVRFGPDGDNQVPQFGAYRWDNGGFERISE